MEGNWVVVGRDTGWETFPAYSVMSRWAITHLDFR